MKNNILLSCLSASLCMGCVLQPMISEGFASVPFRVAPSHLKSISSAKNSAYSLSQEDLAVERAFDQYIKTGISPQIMSDGFVKFAYRLDQQPIIQTSPFQETVVSLEPGERFTNISCGDPSQWSYVVVSSGEDPIQQHVLIKPSLAHLSTNMVVATNKRLYNFRLLSRSIGPIIRQACFWYPQNMIQAMNRTILKQHDLDLTVNKVAVSLNQLNFDYSISCTGGFFSRCPAWKPIRLFDDGLKTYMQFKVNLPSYDMPALFIVRANQQELVNYRFRAPYLIVDRLFKEALLLTGVGKNQVKVRLFNQHYFE